MKTEEKYFEALKELHTVLSYTDKVSISGFAKEKGLSTNMPVVLKHGKIIKNLGGRGVNARYKWNTIAPNIKMAQKVVAEVNNLGAASMRSTRRKAIKGRSRWTIEELNFLENNYHRMKCEELAKNLDRTPKAIQNKAQKLQLDSRRKSIEPIVTVEKPSLTVKPRKTKPQQEYRITILWGLFSKTVKK